MHPALILFVLATTSVENPARPTAPPAAVTPVHHTANFAGQPGWGPGTATPAAAAAPQYDRYATPAGSASQTIAPPPSVIDRGRTAVVETGNALRDGVEASIQAADRELYRGTEQVIDSARNAGQQAAQQFRGWAGTQAEQIAPIANDFLGTTAATSQPAASQSLPSSTTGRRQVSNPFAPATPTATATTSTNSTAAKTRGSVAPPPSWSTTNEPDWENQLPPLEQPRTAALGAPARRTDGGWSSISTTTPPPAMPVPAMAKAPPLPSDYRNNPISPQFATSAASATTSAQQPQQPTTGPGFPATITANPSHDRSLLAQSSPTDSTTQQQEAFSREDVEITWPGTTTSQPPQRATITGRYDQDNTAAAAATISRSPSTPSATVQVQSQPPTSQSAGTPGFDPWDDKDFFGDNQTATTNNGSAGQGGVAGNIAQQPPATSAATQTAPPSSASTTLATTASTAQVPTGNQEPWIPLVFVSVALAGSVGANLFLGWSYMDARQKYRTLVQKTANKFRRITSPA